MIIRSLGQYPNHAVCSTRGLVSCRSLVSADAKVAGLVWHVQLGVEGLGFRV